MWECLSKKYRTVQNNWDIWRSQCFFDIPICHLDILQSWQSWLSYLKLEYYYTLHSLQICLFPQYRVWVRQVSNHIGWLMKGPRRCCCGKLWNWSNGARAVKAVLAVLSWEINGRHVFSPSTNFFSATKVWCVFLLVRHLGKSEESEFITDLETTT